MMEIYLNIRHFEFLANVRTLKFGSELRYGIRSPNVRTPVDIPICSIPDYVGLIMAFALELQWTIISFSERNKEKNTLEPVDKLIAKAK